MGEIETELFSIGAAHFCSSLRTNPLSAYCKSNSICARYPFVICLLGSTKLLSTVLSWTISNTPQRFISTNKSQGISQSHGWPTIRSRDEGRLMKCTHPRIQYEESFIALHAYYWRNLCFICFTKLLRILPFDLKKRWGWENNFHRCFLLLFWYSNIDIGNEVKICIISFNV